MNAVLLALHALLLAPLQVDIALEPDKQSALVGETISVALILSSDEPESISAVDAVITWDPARLELLGTTPGDFPPFIAGFLNDPDGLNDDTTDGEVLYTALAPVSNLASTPPDITVVYLDFEVLTSACVELVADPPGFAKTRVIGAVPGVEITGVIGGPSIVEAPGTWTVLGDALAGTGGLEPTLEGDGVLLPCDPWVLTLDDALPGSTAFVVLGFSNLSAPLKGGVLVPAPDILRSVPVGPTGTRVLSGAWPDGLPGGVEFFLQMWIVDPGGFSGFSASNALRAVTP